MCSGGRPPECDFMELEFYRPLLHKELQLSLHNLSADLKKTSENFSDYSLIGNYVFTINFLWRPVSSFRSSVSFGVLGVGSSHGQRTGNVDCDKGGHSRLQNPPGLLGSLSCSLSNPP